jgi:hypothetical protein
VTKSNSPLAFVKICCRFRKRDELTLLQFSLSGCLNFM